MRARKSTAKDAVLTRPHGSLAATPQHEQATQQSAAETLASADLVPGQPFNPYRRFVGSLVPDAIMKSGDLSATAKLCYGRLARYAGEDGRCFPSMQTLAKELRVTERAARNNVRQLERAGLLRRRSQPGKTNWFEFLWDPRLESSLRRNDGTSKGRNNHSGQVGTNVPPKREKEKSRRQENQFLINPSKSVRVHPLGNDGTEEALKYASERDELIALIQESTKTSPDQQAIRTIQEQLEVRHGTLRAYLDDIRPRLKRLRHPPTISFFVSHAKQ